MNRSITISNSTTATVCTYTNARVSNGIKLSKSWTNGKTGDAVSLSITGGSSAVAGSATVGGTTTNATATGLAGDTISFAEAFTTGSGSNYNQTLSCSKDSDSSAITVSSNSITMPSDSAVTCTFNNSRIAQQISINKQWQNGATGHTISVTSTGGTNNPTLSSTSSGSNSSTGTAVTVYAGDVVTLPAETFGGGASAAQYTSTLACSGGTTLASGAVNRSITISNSTTATVCTYTNARVSNGIKLSKSWTNGKTGDAVSLSITGGSSAVAGSATVGGTTTNATATGLAGDTISFAEAFTTGSGSNYNQTLSCSKDSDSSAITVSSNSITMPSDSAVTCTFNNSRIAQQISINKQWQNGATGHTISVTSTGGTNNPTLSSTSSGSNSSTGTAVTVYAGDVVTLPAETFGGGASAAQYTSTLACSGGTTLASGAVNRSITISSSTTATVCTYTNARKSATLTVRKVWAANSKAGDTVTVSSSGFGSNATSGSSVATAAGNTTTGTAVTVYAGESGTIGESFSVGSASNYNAVLSCTGNTQALTGNTLTVDPADTAIVCTETNTRIAQQISINKQWQNGATGHTISVTSTGGTNNPTLSSTSSGSNSSTGTAVTVYAGDVVTLPAETFGGGASAAQYTSTLACSGGTTLASGAVNRSITISSSTTATVCTYTNARKSATLTVRKVWAANSKAGDTVTVSSSGFGSNATSGSSVATAAGNTTTGTAVTVYAGESGTIGESFSVGSASNYNAVLSCTGNTQALTGNTLTVDPADTAIVCTETNTRIAQQISINKQWQNGATGHTISVTSTGGTNNPTLSSTSSGSNSSTGTAVTVYAGDVVTLPAETFGGGASAAQYTSTLACSGGTTLASGAVNRSITISNSTTATVCTYTNARKSATLTLRKVWVNGIDGDTVTVSSSGFGSNATSGSSISTGNNTTTGTAVTVYAGETGSISEVFSTGNASNYNRVLSCSGTTGLSGNTLTIGNTDTAIVCTYTNTRVQLTVVSGRAFTDNSGTTANASKAYNGVQDAGETGIAGSKVSLTNCASTEIASTTTSASGDYSFSVTPAQLPAPNFCIVQTNVSGYTSVSGTAGYSRSTDTITLSNTGATSYTANNFGDAKLSLVLTEDGQKTVSPGSVVDYPHRLIAGSVMNVNSLQLTATQQPASAADQPWSDVVYRDTNCNGVVDAGEAVFNPATTPLAMLPGQEICLVQRVSSPANASNGAQHIGRLQASYAATLADSSQLTGSSNQRQDTTLIGSAGLTMSKQVRVVASCPSTGADTNPFATQNQASKGDYLEYEITYRNNSTRNLVDIVVKDSVPLGTSYQSMACTVNPTGSCTPTHSGDALIWQTTGLLAPAQEGKVRFCTRVQ